MPRKQFKREDFAACIECGGPFGAYFVRGTCSNRCYKRRWQHPRLATFICAQCGQAAPVVRGSGPRRYCTDCRPSRQPAARVTVCQHCGNVLGAGLAQRRYCSVRCRDRASYARHRVKIIAKIHAWQVKNRERYNDSQRARRQRRRSEAVRAA